MEYQDYAKMGLEGTAPLKLILCGGVESGADGKTGVVAVVYATEDKAAAERKLNELTKANPENYYMVYSVPLNTDLQGLEHYPSIAISKEDLL